MSVLDSYLYEVGQHLPEEQRGDILTDIRAAIEEEASERASSDEFSDEQVLEVLRGFGHPFKVAGRYLPQRALIGPEIFPTYARVLKLFLLIAVAGYVLVTLTIGVTQGWQTGPWRLFWGGVEIVIWMAAVITGVFIAIEYSGEKLKWYESWEPASLSRNQVGWINRQDVITNIIGEGVFLLWWNDILVLQNFLPDGLLEISLAPIWFEYGLYLNILFAACFALHVYVLVRGTWHRVTMVSEIVLYAALIGLGIVLMLADELLVLSGTWVEQGYSEHVHLWPQTVIAVIIVITIWDVLKGLKLWRGGFDPSAIKG